MSTGRPHHYGHLLQVWKDSLQPLTLYTSFYDLTKAVRGSDYSPAIALSEEKDKLELSEDLTIAPL